MRQRRIQWSLALGMGILSLSAGETRAQLAPIGGTSNTGTGSNAGAYAAPSTTAGPMGLYANPYFNPNTNPYMNPYLNPSMMLGATPGTNRTGMGLFMLNNLQNSNGVGSGKLGGPKAGLSGRTSARSRRSALEKDEPVNVSNTPGGSASRYFAQMRSPSVGVNRFYNRQSPR